VFDESSQWNWCEGDDGGGNKFDKLDDMFMVQYRVLHGVEEGRVHMLGPASPLTGAAMSGAGFPTLALGLPAAMPEGPSEEDLDADHDVASPSAMFHGRCSGSSNTTWLCRVHTWCP
jgi:hypothetical protein